MGTYNLPRNVKGEGRILFIFTKKSLAWTVGGVGLGLVFYYLFSFMGLKTVGLIIAAIFALIGFSIGTFKVPNIQIWNWTRLNEGENLDDVIIRAIKFKQKGRKIYIYKGGKEND